MHVHSTTPSPWIVRFAHLIRPGGRVLDVASGSGRHARFFAARGCRVLAIDRDADLLEPLRSVPGVAVDVVDLESGAPWPYRGEHFDAIVVVNYLHRPLFPHLAAALLPEGALLYETFAAGNEVHGPPRNPAFLLEPGELIQAFGSAMTVVAFEQGQVRGGERGAVVQRLAAVGAGRGWPVPLDPSAREAAGTP